VKIINDAAMQALGSYGGTMLFLRSRTGSGTALVADGTVVPLELGHLSIGKKSSSDDLGIRGLKRLGKKEMAEARRGGSRSDSYRAPPRRRRSRRRERKKLKRLPQGCGWEITPSAFLGGFRLWREVLAGNDCLDSKPHHDRRKAKKGMSIPARVVVTIERPEDEEKSYRGYSMR